MKNLINATLVTTLLLSTSAFTAERLFSARQEKRVLQAIDNICGDTWCEGDYNFRFNTFICDKKTNACELNFQFIVTNDDGVDEQFSAVQVCRFENITQFSQLMDGQWSLNDDFYQDVTECITDLESSVEF